MLIGNVIDYIYCKYNIIQVGHKLGTVANFSSATLDTTRNMAEKVGYFSSTMSRIDRYFFEKFII